MALAWLFLVNVVLMGKGLCVSVGATKGQSVTNVEFNDNASHVDLGNHQRGHYNATRAQLSDGHYNATRAQLSDGHYNATRAQLSDGHYNATHMSEYQNDDMEDESEDQSLTVLV
ncbi:uncharacterized protein LOC144088136 isoform X2 [Stigmatopora argus]